MKRSEIRREKQKALVLECLKAGALVNEACSVVGVGTSTFYRWMEVDEDFFDEVVGVRLALLLQALEELRLQAYGRYVKVESVRETDRGPVKIVRTKWVNGKTSALKLVLSRSNESALPPDDEDESVLPADGKDAEVSGDEEVPVKGAENMGNVSQDSLNLGVPAEEPEVVSDEAVPSVATPEAAVPGCADLPTSSSSSEPPSLTVDLEALKSGDMVGDVSRDSLNLEGLAGDGDLTDEEVAAMEAEMDRQVVEMLVASGEDREKVERMAQMVRQYR